MLNAWSHKVLRYYPIIHSSASPCRAIQTIIVDLCALLHYGAILLVLLLVLPCELAVYGRRLRILASGVASQFLEPFDRFGKLVG